ncbi:hypothetical protein C8R47DRAFT_1204120 [Mycena vitilis]|nr:hypothetical protein C8R47DRAFT_1204120 [Mycena vitilis]
MQFSIVAILTVLATGALAAPAPLFLRQDTCDIASEGPFSVRYHPESDHDSHLPSKKKAYSSIDPPRIERDHSTGSPSFLIASFRLRTAWYSGRDELFLRPYTIQALGSVFNELKGTKLAHELNRQSALANAPSAEGLPPSSCDRIASAPCRNPEQPWRAAARQYAERQTIKKALASPGGWDKNCAPVLNESQKPNCGLARVGTTQPRIEQGICACNGKDYYNIGCGRAQRYGSSLPHPATVFYPHRVETQSNAWRAAARQYAERQTIEKDLASPGGSSKNCAPMLNESQKPNYESRPNPESNRGSAHTGENYVNQETEWLPAANRGRDIRVTVDGRQSAGRHAGRGGYNLQVGDTAESKSAAIDCGESDGAWKWWHWARQGGKRSRRTECGSRRAREQDSDIQAPLYCAWVFERTELGDGKEGYTAYAPSFPVLLFRSRFDLDQTVFHRTGRPTTHDPRPTKPGMKGGHTEAGFSSLKRWRRASEEDENAQHGMRTLGSGTVCVNLRLEPGSARTRLATHRARTSNISVSNRSTRTVGASSPSSTLGSRDPPRRLCFPLEQHHRSFIARKRLTCIPLGQVTAQVLRYPLSGYPYDDALCAGTTKELASLTRVQRAPMRPDAILLRPATDGDGLLTRALGATPKKRLYAPSLIHRIISTSPASRGPRHRHAPARSSIQCTVAPQRPTPTSGTSPPLTWTMPARPRVLAAPRRASAPWSTDGAAHRPSGSSAHRIAAHAPDARLYPGTGHCKLRSMLLSSVPSPSPLHSRALPLVGHAEGRDVRGLRHRLRIGHQRVSVSVSVPAPARSRFQRLQGGLLGAPHRPTAPRAHIPAATSTLRHSRFVIRRSLRVGTRAKSQEPTVVLYVCGEQRAGAEVGEIFFCSFRRGRSSCPSRRGGDARGGRVAPHESYVRHSPFPPTASPTYVSSPSSHPRASQPPTCSMISCDVAARTPLRSSLLKIAKGSTRASSASWFADGTTGVRGASDARERRSQSAEHGHYARLPPRRQHTRAGGVAVRHSRAGGAPIVRARRHQSAERGGCTGAETETVVIGGNRYGEVGIGTASVHRDRHYGPTPSSLLGPLPIAGTASDELERRKIARNRGHDGLIDASKAGGARWRESDAQASVIWVDGIDLSACSALAGYGAAFRGRLLEMAPSTRTAHCAGGRWKTRHWALSASHPQALCDEVVAALSCANRVSRPLCAGGFVLREDGALNPGVLDEDERGVRGEMIARTVRMASTFPSSPIVGSSSSTLAVSPRQVGDADDGASQVGWCRFQAKPVYLPLLIAAMREAGTR